MADPQSEEDFQHTLDEYKVQLEQVEQLLLSEPGNEEYAEIYKSLEEAIELTTELLNSSKQTSGQQEAGTSRPAARKLVTEAPHMHLPSILPPQVAEQIRSAQQKAALTGQAPAAWAIGGRCQAFSTIDGQWYTSRVTGLSEAGNFVVQLESTGEEEEIEKQRVRAVPDELDTYRGVQAPTRKAVADPTEKEDGPIEIPKWLEIKDTDNEKTRQKKKKLQKSLKSKMRFQKLDNATKQRQESWLNFKKGKGSKKKAGFLSSGKKTSIFAVPDNADGKVGVIGSGKGMTDYTNAERHDFN